MRHPPHPQVDGCTYLARRLPVVREAQVVVRANVEAVPRGARHLERLVPVLGDALHDRDVRARRGADGAVEDVLRVRNDMRGWWLGWVIRIRMVIYGARLRWVCEG